MIWSFLFQLCILVSYSGDNYYNCNIDVFILDNQTQVQAWWDEIYAEKNDGKKWDGWPVQSFWYSQEKWIVLHNTKDFEHEWRHAWCWMYYFYHDNHNHQWCEERPHFKLQF